jgi:eukaryotic-like serine/threonine-protein kinase
MATPQEPAKSLFLNALEITGGEERQAYVDECCAGNELLRQEVNALLAHHQQLDSFLDSSPAEFVPTMTIGSPTESPGTVIGPYKLLEQIGEGGMGAVWMAEQKQPLRRRVAVKVIKAGMDSRQVLARFEAERQALALMDHPNIARVLDAGVTDAGRPYFVMELVKGTPITQYCDDQQLSVRERLELFGDVCHAVQHAHQKGIIHRDLKPSNILIAPFDGKPVVKVIDFGVAKATGQRLTDETLFTGFGAVVGTPEYMSPEQAEVNNADIDTRSDIYSLGVLLYELLAGSTPLTSKRVKEAALLEVLRIIREEEPPRPSTRLTTVAELPRIAAQRGLEAKSLSGIVKGELDWIVMKALEKDRARRYETATALAADIERHLTGEPVVAAPPGRLYRMRKYFWRHRAAVLTGTALAGLLVTGVIGTTWAMFQAWRATEREAAQRQTAEERAEQLERVSKFQASQLADIKPARMGTGIRDQILERFQRDLTRQGLEESAIDESLGQLDEALSRVNFTNVAMETLEEYVFERALQTIDQDFADQPLLQAQLLQTTADTMHALGLLARATGPQMKALEIRRNELGSADPRTLESMRMLGDLLRANGRYREGLETMREVVANAKRTLGMDHPETLKSLKKLAFILVHADDHDEATREVRDALEGCRRVFGDKDPETSEAYAINGMMLRCGAGRYQEGAECLRTALEGLRDSLGDEHPSTLQTQLNLVWAVLWLGDVNEAEALCQEAYATSLRVLGDDHPNTLFGLDNMGLVRVAQGRLDEAVEYHRRALEGRRRVLGDQHTETLRSMWHLGRVLWRARGAAEAEPLFREALDGPKEVFPWGKWLRPYVLIELADLLQETGRLEESERLKAEAADLVRGFAFQPWGCTTFAVVMVSNAQTLQSMKRYAEAESHLLEAHAFLDGKPGPVRAWAHAVKSPDDYTSEAVIRRLIELYDAWSAAEPESAAEIKAKAARWSNPPGRMAAIDEQKKP